MNYNYNTIYAIGIAITFLIGFSNLILTIRSNKKSIFINSITNSRIKYIQEIRNSISDFCGIIYSYNSRLHELNPEQLIELHKQIDRTKYLIRLYLDPEIIYWDNKIITLLNEIISLTDKDPTSKIDELIVLTQYLLKLEWAGVKLESEKGILNSNEKKELNLKYINLHKKHIKDKIKNE